MPSRVFYSFHFALDHWRAGQVRSIGALEGNTELSDNDWEAVKRRGDAAIKNWIDGQMADRSCVVVLVGQETARRPWVKYEIERAWETGKGLLGIRINKLLNANGNAGGYGENPFAQIRLNGIALPASVTLYDPPGGDSRIAYANIKDNIPEMVRTAVAARRERR